MYKLLIADDEPLVQAGIKSMVKWSDLDVEVVGTAGNGQIALDIINGQDVDIVITDIRMPVMSGLELCEKSAARGQDVPVFIILTSYEDFSYVRTAIKYQAIDYLVKIELTPDTLTEAVKKAIDRVNTVKDSHNAMDLSVDSVALLKEQFFMRLIFNLFENEEQVRHQAKNLNIDFDEYCLSVAYVELNNARLTDMPLDKQISLYTSSLQIAGELAAKYAKCHVLSLDTAHFAIIFFLPGDSEKIPDHRNVIRNALEQISTMLYNYYSVTIMSSIGQQVIIPSHLSVSFQDAKRVVSFCSAEKPIVFAEDMLGEASPKNVFNISLFKEDIRKAYTEFDDKALYDIFTSICELFEGREGYYVQALDAAGNILYLSLSLLNNGEEIVAGIFSDSVNGYRSLYEMTTTEQIIGWLKKLRDGLCESFLSHNKDYKNHIVVNVKKYVNEHIREKLTLNKVSEVFNISPNYLSVLFSKHNDVGFVDYVSQQKIEEAKKLIKSGEYKVYEISDILGFENAFYFSRVFKKVTGVSPRDYLNAPGI